MTTATKNGRIVQPLKWHGGKHYLAEWIVSHYRLGEEMLQAARLIVPDAPRFFAVGIEPKMRVDEMRSAIATALFWSAAMCAMHVQLPNWWSAIIPQAGRHTATLFGLTNGIGVFGALASQGFVGIFADWQESRGLTGREQWDPIFDVYVIVLVLGGLAWLLYRFTPLPEPPAKEEPKP